MTTQTTTAEEDARHVELANQDEAAAISKVEAMRLMKRFFARLWSRMAPEATAAQDLFFVALDLELLIDIQAEKEGAYDAETYEK